MAIFDAGDIVEVAVRIEENGAAFYHRAASHSNNQEIKALFTRLAEEEGQHRKTFMELRKALEPTQPPEGYDEEYRAYLKSYVDHILVFNDETLARELKKVSDDETAFDFAIQREFESILYYQEVRGLLGQAQQKIIDEIIAEERRHVTLLTERKKALHS